MYKGYLRTMKLSYQSATGSIIRNQSVQFSPVQSLLTSVITPLLLLESHYSLVPWSPWNGHGHGHSNSWSISLTVVCHHHDTLWL